MGGDEKDGNIARVQGSLYFFFPIIPGLNVAIIPKLQWKVLLQHTQVSHQLIFALFVFVAVRNKNFTHTCPSASPQFVESTYKTAGAKTRSSRPQALDGCPGRQRPVSRRTNVVSFVWRIQARSMSRCACTISCMAGSYARLCVSPGS